MKEKITEYQPTENTVTYIQCDGCDTRWEDRHDDGINRVALDTEVLRKSLGDWKENGKYRWEYALSGMYPHKLSGNASAEYCDSCFDGFFTTGHAVEITETEYELKEETIEEYYCDFCGTKTGESPDHEVLLNPRIEVKDHNNPAIMQNTRKTSKIVHSLDQRVSWRSSQSGYAIYDDKFDCCEKCSREMFPVPTGTGTGLVTQLCTQIKNIF